MKSLESRAKTMEEAVTQGLEKLGCSLGDVTIDILDEGSKGFLGIIGGKPVVVRLTMRDGADDTDILSGLSFEESGKSQHRKTRSKKKTVESGRMESGKIATSAKSKSDDGKAEKKGMIKNQTNASFDVTEKKVDSAVQTMHDEQTPEGKAQQFLLKVTALMGVQVSVGVYRDEEGNIRVEMHGDTQGILIGRRGETLDALQYLTSLNVNRGQEGYIRVTLDNENYRAKREEALTRLANRMASRAVKTGRKVVMEPMNPYERRILHSALQKNTAVSTHSEGDEPNRHVVITLKSE